MIYFDNAATTLKKPPQVIQAVMQAMTTMGNSSRGTHESCMNAAFTVYNTRRKLAELFHCSQADHVVFAANATEALNIAINGAIPARSHVITTDCEHNSVLRPLYRLSKERGVQLDYVPADKKGRLCTVDFEKLIRDNTSAIVCTHASNLTGNIMDIAAIGAIAKKHSLLFIVDASQTAGCVPIDMSAMHIDILCFTGHKGLMGPQGTGGLCIADGIEVRPWKTGGSGVQSYLPEQPEEYPTRLEAGTLNGHGLAGLSAALDFIAETGLDTIRQKEHALMNRFYEGVKSIPAITVYGDFEQDRTAVVTLNIKGYDSGVVSDELSEVYGIATRPGAHCAPRMHQALGTVEDGAVRFSFSYFNTEEEVDQAIAALREMCEDL